MMNHFIIDIYMIDIEWMIHNCSFDVQVKLLTKNYWFNAWCIINKLTFVQVKEASNTKEQVDGFLAIQVSPPYLTMMVKPSSSLWLSSLAMSDTTAYEP